MGISYEVISGDNRGFAPQYGTTPSSATVTEAARYADSVVAIESGIMRQLTPTRGRKDGAGRRHLMDTRKLRELGERDAVLGKPIEAFYAIPDIDHSDEARAEYEKAYWGTVAELAREGH